MMPCDESTVDGGSALCRWLSILISYRLVGSYRTPTEATAVILNEVFERFAEESPVSVMARAVLENALAPTAVDARFGEVAEHQYTRDLLFSDVVDLMGMDVCKVRPSIRAPYVRLAYAARDWNHPKMSSGEMACKAGPIALEIASVVRAAADRSASLTFENISSICQP
jgi:hypothetical protein